MGRARDAGSQSSDDDEGPELVAQVASGDTHPPDTADQLPEGGASHGASVRSEAVDDASEAEAERASVSSAAAQSKPGSQPARQAAQSGQRRKKKKKRPAAAAAATAAPAAQQPDSGAVSALLRAGPVILAAAAALGGALLLWRHLSGTGAARKKGGAAERSGGEVAPLVAAGPPALLTELNLQAPESGAGLRPLLEGLTFALSDVYALCCAEKTLSVSSRV